MSLAIICSVALVLLMGGGYLLLLTLAPLFFDKPGVWPTTHRLVSSLLIIILGTGLAMFVAALISDPQLANRVLHALAGGFMAFVTCYLVVRDSGIPISRFQFFIIAALTVTMLGVGNELVEFGLQEWTGHIFSPTTIDTWQDLTSNTVGILIAACIFTPFHKKSRQVACPDTNIGIVSPLP